MDNDDKPQRERECAKDPEPWRDIFAHVDDEGRRVYLWNREPLGCFITPAAARRVAKTLNEAFMGLYDRRRIEVYLCDAVLDEVLLLRVPCG